MSDILQRKDWDSQQFQQLQMIVHDIRGILSYIEDHDSRIGTNENNIITNTTNIGSNDTDIAALQANITADVISIAEIDGTTLGAITSGVETLLPLAASHTAHADLTVDTTNNRIINVTGETITVISTLELIIQSSTNDGSLDAKIKGATVILGEQFRIASNTTEDNIFVLTRFATLLDDEYIDAFIEPQANMTLDPRTGGTLRVRRLT